ncbi:hypothetical protein H2200_009338 [Cladophialophora chaetospira]|uniref:Xylanolytic transcriptional activator regulatory domain-containing protein n=1 Tax=Cladophialophora chaetospira TaxID=386627 RepID=A0AA38X3X2_9EURO|nr:hypothetical protein H2200_009338 [Cladophialophora chaetospira]
MTTTDQYKSIYHFYRDEEVLAWRTIGLAARISLEMGLHLWDPPYETFRNPHGRERTNRLFWCIYCLDRRWSFGTGLPFGIQEDDIDPSLPEPNDSHPYLLTSMITYSRIGSKILKTSSGAERAEREDTAFLTYQVQQWYSSLDPEVRVDDDQDLVVVGLSPARNRLRILNRLRKNQLLMLIHRKALFTSTSIAADPRGAKTAVDLARATITMLERIRKTSEIYQSHAVCFNYFLYSALTVILLAAYHAKARFHEYCREEFNMALNLMGGISAKSNVARKLWQIIKHLKVMGPELGILPYMETQQDNPRRECEGHTESNDKTLSWSQSQTQLYGGMGADSGQMLPGAREVSGLGNLMTHTDIPMFTNNYIVDGNLLCSELTDLFQAIDPTRYEQIPPHLLDQSRSQPSTSTFPMPDHFSRTVRNVF